MVRSPRCALHGARPRAAAGNPSRGRAPAPAPPPAARGGRKKRKENGEKAAGGGAGGGSPEPQVPGRKFHGKGRAVAAPAPAPTSQNDLETTADLPRHSRHFPPLPGGQSPCRESPAAPVRARGPREPHSPGLRADPAPNRGGGGGEAGQRAAGLRGARRRGTGSARPPGEPRIYI